MKRTQIKSRPLKDTVLNGLEPEEKEYRELDSNGLYFRVKPNGNKSWQLQTSHTLIMTLLLLFDQLTGGLSSTKRA